MEILKTRAQLASRLSAFRDADKLIGLVPTMGALHNGHLSLVNEARKHTDIVVCSIFVNPTQFNDPTDLERYPRPIENDIEKLTPLCDVLFMPEVSEMYASGEQWHIDLGRLEYLLEGRFRPGHYQGVTQIVKKLFDAVQPDKAFFGQKDFQQFKIIDSMVKQLHLPVELVMCPIIRESDGLAMSSRNVHLSPAEHQQALALSKTLLFVQQNFENRSIAELNKSALEMLNRSEGVELDYFQICDADTLDVVNEKTSKHVIALLAARVGNTRLIDNIILQ
ncbi:MAG: pantoate--beta-alanine ligase [Sphingobacteriaceae bacterium]|nr:pantoate--beta-alanine ligase [Sphingobacteriaceae bacterium]